MILAFAAGITIVGLRPSEAQVNWKEEFDAVCGKTDIAMTLAPEELKGLIERCDRLKTRIEGEEESTRKVYLRRLQMCRELYAFVLDTRERPLP
jgi:hypothetical protein